MARLTPEEIEQVKNAVKPLTDEERAGLKAIRFGEAAPEVAKAGKPVTTGVPEEALKAKALELGVPVSGLTQEQVEEAKASLPGKTGMSKKKK